MIDVTDFVSRCDRPVSDIGFAKVGGRAMCRECSSRVKASLGSSSNSLVCRRCGDKIDGDPLRFQGDVYHSYHFNCSGLTLGDTI